MSDRARGTAGLSQEGFQEVSGSSEWALDALPGPSCCCRWLRGGDAMKILALLPVVGRDARLVELVLELRVGWVARIAIDT